MKICRSLQFRPWEVVDRNSLTFACSKTCKSGICLRTRNSRTCCESPNSRGTLGNLQNSWDSEEIRAYQVGLINEKKLAPKSISTAFSALRFLYTITLKKNWLVEDVIPAPKVPQTVPVVPRPRGGPPFSRLCRLRSWYRSPHVHQRFLEY